MWFTDDDRREAEKAGAPYRKLLEVAPLWVTTHLACLTTEVAAHATLACTEIPAHVGDLPHLDPELRLIQGPESATLRLCWCMAPNDERGGRGGKWHPLRQLHGLTTFCMAATTDILVAERAYLAAVKQARYATQYTSRPELAFWQEWLEEALAASARRLDALRTERFGTCPVSWAANDVLMSLALFPYDATDEELLSTGVIADEDLDILDMAHRRALLASPVLVRLVEASEFVVRVPQEVASAAESSDFHPLQRLGPVRPMTDEAWHLYEQLCAASYSCSEAYGAAADSVGRLDSESKRIVDALSANGVPASELISTAIAMAR